MTENKHLKYWIALSHIIQGRQLNALFNFFNHGEEAWNASEHQLLQATILPKSAKRIIDLRKNINPDKCFDTVSKNNIETILLDDKNYPRLLKEISDPPTLLYFKGDIPAPKTKLMAVVGSRRVSDYSKMVAMKLNRNLAMTGISLVSGLARGVDSIAHHACIEAGTPTVAVVGNGLGKHDLYPTENKKLAEQIINSAGAIVSEYPPGTRPQKYYFPARNRIIAGMTAGTLVTSAPVGSGTLITAYAALDENREVFAVPGPITDPMYVGNNNLLKRGAHVVTEAEDVLKVMNWEPTKSNDKDIKINLSADEKVIYDCIEKTPLHIDELTDKTSLDKQNALTQVTVLELKGYIKDIGGKRYIRL